MLLNLISLSAVTYKVALYDVTISGTGEICRTKFNNSIEEQGIKVANVSSINVQEGITSIGYESFYQCFNLT